MASRALSALSPDALVSQSARTASRIVEGRAVVIVIDAHRLHALSEVGTRIWELAEGRSIAEIARTLTLEYDVDHSTALTDTRAFVAEMLDLGAVTIGAPE